jgi:hypothetical protein
MGLTDPSVPAVRIEMRGLMTVIFTVFLKSVESQTAADGLALPIG